MTVFDRRNITVVAIAGLCGAGIALSPDAAAAPLKTGGYACVQGMSGETDAEFSELLEFLEEAKLDRVGCFERIQKLTAHRRPERVNRGITHP